MINRKRWGVIEIVTGAVLEYRYHYTLDGNGDPIDDATQKANVLAASAAAFAVSPTDYHVEDADALSIPYLVYEWNGSAFVESLAAAKEKRYVEIDRDTERLIAGGFGHAGKTFSLSAAAQSKWLGLAQIGASLDPSDFPIVVPTIDDLGTHSIADNVEIQTMLSVAFGTVKAHLDSGEALKASVRVAADLAGVAAVVDNR